VIDPDRLILLDTSALVVLARGKAEGTRLNERILLRERADMPLISAVSAGELLALVRKWNWGERRVAGARGLLSSLVTVGIGLQPILETYARFSADLEKAGRRMGQQNDIWIAATAAATDAVLVTLERDFDDLHPEHITRVYIDPRELVN